jgi:predicted secreted protein
MEELNDIKIEVLAHCLLNSHTRVKGLAPLRYSPAGATVQLPCPEALYLGLSRWAVTRNQLDVPEFRRFCQKLIEPYADLLQMLTSDGKRISVVGVAGSPSCGVATTSAGYAGGRVQECEHRRISGRGIFMEELLAELERRGVGFTCREISSQAERHG